MAKPKSQHPPHVPEIKEGVVPLWHAGYWDGPLSGICRYQGEPHYFDNRRVYHGREMEKKVGRTFWLYKLTPEQWKPIEYWHSEWRLHVGTHCDYEWSEENKRYQRAAGTNGLSNEYYKEMYYDRRAAYDKENGGGIEHNIDRYNQVVGYFIWDVLMGKPWFPWRRPRKKKAREKSVLGEEKGT